MFLTGGYLESNVKREVWQREYSMLAQWSTAFSHGAWGLAGTCGRVDHVHPLLPLLINSLLSLLAQGPLLARTAPTNKQPFNINQYYESDSPLTDLASRALSFDQDAQSSSGIGTNTHGKQCNTAARRFEQPSLCRAPGQAGRHKRHQPPLSI